MTITLLYGGTFDPVHTGHLHIARQLLSVFSDATISLIPCQIPPHRGQPGASPAKRLRMLELAIQDEPDMRVDDCELVRDGKSFTIDTLKLYRRQLGPDTPVAFVMGVDSWNTLPGWREWCALTDYAHLIVVGRPDHMADIQGVLGDFADGKVTDSPDTLLKTPAGKVYFAELEETPAAATEIRNRLCSGEDAGKWLQPEVAEYIRSEGLYRGHNGE